MKKHANHKPTPREPEIPFKTLLDKIDQMDLTRTITNNHKRLYEVHQSTSNQQIDINQVSDLCSNTYNLSQSNLDQLEDAVCNVLNGINNTYDKKISKADQSLHYSAVIVVHRVIPKVDVSKDYRENNNVNHEKDHSTVT